MSGYQVERTAPAPAPRRIDYERMSREFPKQRRRLAAADKTGDPVRVAELCLEITDVWDEIGAWPDDWPMLQRALDDVLPWRQQVSLDDLVSGAVKITRGG